MKKMHSLIAVSALAAALPLAASAAPEPGAYLGLNYMYLDADDVNLDAAFARGGLQLNEWVAIEGRLGTGITDDSFGPSIARTKVELEHFYGGYVVAGIPNQSIVYPYAVAGYTWGKMKGTLQTPVGSTSSSESESDFSYGIGADIRFTDALMGNVEVMRYMDKNDVEFDGFSVGVKMAF